MNIYNEIKRTDKMNLRIQTQLQTITINRIRQTIATNNNLTNKITTDNPVN